MEPAITQFWCLQHQLHNNCICRPPCSHMRSATAVRPLQKILFLHGISETLSSLEQIIFRAENNHNISWFHHENLSPSLDFLNMCKRKGTSLEAGTSLHFGKTPLTAAQSEVLNMHWRLWKHCFVIHGIFNPRTWNASHCIFHDISLVRLWVVFLLYILIRCTLVSSALELGCRDV